MDSVEQASLNFFFSTIPLAEFPPPPGGKVISIPSDVSIAQAVEMLTQNNILAAPIENTDSSSPNKYLGIIDMVHIACYLLDHSHEKHDKPAIFQEYDLMKTTLKDVHVADFWAKFVPLQQEDTLLDAMLIMGNYGVHRVPVVDKEGNIINIITQSAVVDQISKHMDEFKEVCSKSIEELGLADRRECFKVTIDSPLRDAIRAIRDHHVSAVPVLGFGDIVVGNVSARDIRQLIIKPDNYRMIRSPVRVFINAITAVEHEAMSPAITSRPKDTLEKLLVQLATSKIHRTYVCDNSGHLLRVVTLTDIIAKFVSPPTPDYFKRFSL